MGNSSQRQCRKSQLRIRRKCNAGGSGFSIPFIAFYEGRTYGQPEVVRISLPQVATGLRLRLPGSFRRRAFHARPAHAARGTLRQRAHSMQAVITGHSYAEGVPADTIFFLGKTLPAGNQSRIRQKGGNGAWRFFIIQ